MTQERDQGPHYISELDPNSKKSPINWHNKILLCSLVALVINIFGFVGGFYINSELLKTAFGIGFVVSLGVIMTYVTAAIQS
jgi:hypothetical protein